MKRAREGFGLAAAMSKMEHQIAELNRDIDSSGNALPEMRGVLLAFRDSSRRSDRVFVQKIRLLATNENLGNVWETLRKTNHSTGVLSVCLTIAALAVECSGKGVDRRRRLKALTVLTTNLLRTLAACPELEQDDSIFALVQLCNKADAALENLEDLAAGRQDEHELRRSFVRRATHILSRAGFPRKGRREGVSRLLGTFWNGYERESISRATRPKSNRSPKKS